MKISIHNFKSIGSLVDYELKPLTILSGTNSSGKSSFIQLLLLLKQTIEIGSSKFPLYLDGEYYPIGDYLDIIKGKDKSNQLSIKFSIDKSEFEKYSNKIIKSIFDGFPDYTCVLQVIYNFNQNSLYISKFSLTYISSFSEKDNYVEFIQDLSTNKVEVKSNNEYFIKEVFNKSQTLFSNISYTSIFPSSYETIRFELIESSKKGEPPLVNEIKRVEYPNITSIKSFIENFFNNLYYIGPVRIEPLDIYPNAKEVNSVGIKGNYVAQILEKRKDDKISIYLPNFEEDSLKYDLHEISLIDATSYWICNIFKFGKNIYAKKVGESYSIMLVNNYDIETTIKHVGFGISQVLPIIVQGLLLKVGDTLIIEQPEIHLHPKIQSLLFDFLYLLIIQNKNIIVETHSDHFITRMRRRIAEDETNVLKTKINLTFIENGRYEIIFRSLNLDDFGALEYFPNDFIENRNGELKGIIKAQMKKRLSE